MKKKRTVTIVLIASLAAAFGIAFVVWMFGQQYNSKGYSRYVNLTVNGDYSRLVLRASDGEQTLYTCGIGDCSLQTVNAKTVRLEDVLFQKVEIPDLTRYMEKQEWEDAEIYQWENYMIIGRENTYVLAARDASVKEIYELLK